MKQMVLKAVVCAFAGVLLAGCEPKSAPQKPVKKVATVRPSAAPEKRAEKKPKPAKVVQPGSIEYLDTKYGFRDVTFDMPVTEFKDLIPAGGDLASNLKTYTRTGDELQLNAVPLEKIEYSFIDDKLCQVSVCWKMEYPAQASRTPPASGEVPALCSSLYGRPTRKNADKDSSSYIWNGKKASVLISETRTPGVANIIKGGWSIPPTTSGKMVIYSRALERNASAGSANSITSASQIARIANGL